MVHQIPSTAEEKEQIYQSLVSLPVNERAELVNRLFKESGLGVGVTGGTNTFIASNDVMIQVSNLSDDQQLALVKQIIDKFQNKADSD